jgi:hypothetical protein
MTFSFSFLSFLLVLQECAEQTIYLRPRCPAWRYGKAWRAWSPSNECGCRTSHPSLCPAQYAATPRSAHRQYLHTLLTYQKHAILHTANFYRLITCQKHLPKAKIQEMLNSTTHQIRTWCNLILPITNSWMDNSLTFYILQLKWVPWCWSLQFIVIHTLYKGFSQVKSNLK